MHINNIDLCRGCLTVFANQKAMDVVCFTDFVSRNPWSCSPCMICIMSQDIPTVKQLSRSASREISPASIAFWRWGYLKLIDLASGASRFACHVPLIPSSPKSEHPVHLTFSAPAGHICTAVWECKSVPVAVPNPRCSTAKAAEAEHLYKQVELINASLGGCAMLISFAEPQKEKTVALPGPVDKALLRSGHWAVWARTRKSNCPRLGLTIEIAG